MNFLGNNRSKLLGGLLVLVALCVGAFLLFGGLGGNDRANVPVTGPNNPLPAQNDNQGQLGRMFVARSVSNSGCPTDRTDQFDPQDTIYVGLERSQIPAGTSLFVRLYQNGRPLEDTDEITADREMDGCVWFEFTPSGGFEPDEYSAELYVNGSRAGRMDFEVTGNISGFSGGSSLSDVQLGQGVIASQVDSNGCPVNRADTFYSDESVYVAFERSFIPAGTEVFARLNYEGQPVEDTDVIIADRDLESCFWFVFEPDSAGFSPGDYSVDVFVNGGRMDSMPLQIR